MPLLVLSPAIGMTLFGPNWNGNYNQDDSLAQIIDDKMPLGKSIFTVVFSLSGRIDLIMQNAIPYVRILHFFILRQQQKISVFTGPPILERKPKIFPPRY